MKPLSHKIKDLVEPQTFDEGQNYASDLAGSLAAYRFTDATADLLARWLDALANLPRGRGTAQALAGLRGVGKSHTLAAFSALVALPELRSSVTDAHVATSARRLMNRRYIVARVERGTRPTLLEELTDALARAFGDDSAAQWQNDPAALLAMAASRQPDATLVLIIDSAFGRNTRISRNDGPVLSELARAAQTTNTFVAVALDDDIAGADGANVALAGTFHIDYLDPEHLHRVADLYVLRKSGHVRLVLHDIYTQLRQSAPGFNWSEPRFTALYPVHPLIADIAAAVRLYAPTFAFLPFAAAAAQRATGRPAHSLVLLDEVFDRAEYELRKSEDLTEPFAVYDKLTSVAIAQLPVMERLEAKLLLKGLFILSLDGRGATARELCAALLLQGVEAPDAVVNRVEGILHLFAQTAAPNEVHAALEERDTRYRFQINSSSGFDQALAASVERLALDKAALYDLLSAAARHRFEDWPLTDESHHQLAEAELYITWRGSSRLGSVVWQSGNALPDPPAQPSEFDWKLVVLAPPIEALDLPGGTSLNSELASEPFDLTSSDAPLLITWRPAKLTPEELDALRRLLVLRTDDAIVAEFSETASAAEGLLAAQAERIWSRLYIDDGSLFIGGASQAWASEAGAATTLAYALEGTLAPVLASPYPQHPVFAETLGETEVANLLDAFGGAANLAEAEMQHLIRSYAAPLGLALMRGTTYTLDAGDELLSQPWIREVLALTEAAHGEDVLLTTVRSRLAQEPYGLTREAQQLVLTALVAQRRIELVTAAGTHISRRMLNRSFQWQDVAGVCRAKTIHHSAEQLTAWARLLTNQPSLGSISDLAAREKVRTALAEWLAGWRAEASLERFEQLPDNGLLTRVSNLAASVRRSFGAVADAIQATLDEHIPLEECLQRMADAFTDSSEAFARHAGQLAELNQFLSGLNEREHARRYLAFAEPTSVDEIESARRELLMMADDAHSLFDRDSQVRFNLLWDEFKRRYMEHYAMVHDQTTGRASGDQRGIDAVLRGSEWREFEALAGISIMNRKLWEEAQALVEQFRDAHCGLPVRQLLEQRPMCGCSFRLCRAVQPQRAEQDLVDTVEHGRAVFRQTLLRIAEQLADGLQTVAHEEQAQNAPTANRALELATAFQARHLPNHLSVVDARIIEQVLQRTTNLPAIRIEFPIADHRMLTREELQSRLEQWLADLPDYSLFEVTNET